MKKTKNSEGKLPQVKYGERIYRAHPTKGIQYKEGNKWKILQPTPMTSKKTDVKKELKEFQDNYVEYSDMGVYVNFIGKNGVDLDDWIMLKLEIRNQMWRDKIEKVTEEKEPIRSGNSYADMSRWRYNEGFNEAMQKIREELLNN